MNDNDPTPTLADMDCEAALNIRDWVRKAIEAKGGRFTGGGVGFGGSDLDVEIEGQHFNIFIKPIMR